MNMKTFSRTAMAVSLASCYFAGAAASATSTPVALTSTTVTSKLGELPVLRTFNTAGNASGEFAVTLQTPTQTELLIFKESGSSLGAPVIVPLSTSGSEPSGLAIDKNGDVAVAWNEVVGSDYYPFFGNATITNTVYVQRYNSTGTAKGARIVVSKTMASDSVSATNGGPETIYASSFSQPQVAMDDDSDVAVAWTAVETKCSVLNFSAQGYCYGTTGSESSKTYAVLYNSAGAVTVAPEVVDSLGYGTASQAGYGHANILTGMRMSGAGNLVLLYDGARDATASVFAHLFGPGLVSKGAPFKLAAVKPMYIEYVGGKIGPLVNLEHDTGSYIPPPGVFGGNNLPSYLTAVGMDASGNFDVAWVNGSTYAVYVTRYDATGGVIGSNIGPVASLDTSTNGSCGASVAAGGDDFQLAMSSNGSFAVTWGEALPFTGTGKVDASCSMEKHARFYTSAGVANGAAVLISAGATITFNPDASLSAMDGNGKLLSVWNAISDPNTKSTDTLEGQLNVAP